LFNIKPSTYKKIGYIFIILVLISISLKIMTSKIGKELFSSITKLAYNSDDINITDEQEKWLKERTNPEWKSEQY
jgi:hypothetical protein